LTNVSSHEKMTAAFSSVIAAVFLTAFKLIVGISTGSLGILSEAAHSGLDLMAAAMTLFAVRAADKPADSEHHYGHGKFENISALFETILLLLTCFLIAREAIERLFIREVVIEVTRWSFVVMATSIAIDFTRARILSRTAKKYHSQALEADALHFSTDILSSSVVIFGLIGAKFGLNFADPVAALGVSVIVVWISLRLGKRTIDVLVDRSPDPALVTSIRTAALASGEITELKKLRVRDSGGRLFVDMVVGLPRLLPFDQAHKLMDGIEQRVRKIRDGIDVVVHAEPIESGQETELDKVQFAAALTGSKIHEVEIYSTETGLVVDLHLEVGDADTIEKAHQKADELEASIRSQMVNVDRIFIHIDKSPGSMIEATSVNFRNSELPRQLLEYVGGRREVVSCGNLNFTESESGLRVAMTCQLDEKYSLAETVRIVNELEEDIIKEFPQISKAVIHQEPVSPGRK
jgi:cation diffusion facilitator family transporter